MFEKVLKNKWWWVWLSLLFVAVIYLASLSHFRIDLTKEKRFSLSNSTKRVLKELDEPVMIDIYLTGDLSAGFKKLSVASDELLGEFKEYAKGNLQYRFIRPGEGLPDTLRYEVYDSLVRMGIKPFNNQVTAKEGEEKTERLIFPAATVMYGGRQLPVDLTSGKSGMDEESTLNYSEALLEFKFADAIDKLTRKEFPIVAYAAGNGEPLPPNGKIKDLFVTMSKNYRFGVIDVKSGRLDADTINALLIVKPSETFTEVEKLKIDQYIMQGGNVIWFVDKLYAEMDSLLRAQSDFVAFDKNLNVDDILFKYGVRINGDLVQDLKSAKQPLVVGQVGNQPQIQRLPFPYYPLLSSPSTHPVAKNLDDVLSIFPGSIDTVKATGIKKTILLASDTNSRSLSTPAIVSLQSVKNEEDLRLFRRSYIPVAVLLEGKFTSLFANRLTNELRDSLSTFTAKPFLPAAVKEGKQIVVSDGDIVTNVVTESDGALPMGVQQYENYPFANKEFLMNAVDYLVNPNGVLESRSKDFTLRLLDKQKILTQKTMWQMVNIVLPILLVVLFGWLYQLKRKKRFAS
ncbi:gliding motility-associated ABC transporter substrate-binding protein GldG [Segetibacter sp.]|jgi:ABC-2 type transport system permease protein|uniref:gliding motility-associated ABC transporter substrate-binding protein GldG n=1 Tax=Segetibacter sp. TaxID=2231182 RepID=UPI002615A135|nr:gliding motility-associated ABC transporter substrate-binding protein GldG [Segetibacter sp.]MCW3081822.1 gldG [Segetibacter sp.]